MLVDVGSDAENVTDAVVVARSTCRADRKEQIIRERSTTMINNES